MYEILFDESASETNDNFHKGFNVTVRRGSKHVKNLEIDQKVKLVGLTGQDFGEATVVQMVIGPIEYIPEVILKFEHDPKCRDMGGLIEVLQNCYDDPSIDFKEVVTAIVLFID